MTFDDPEPPPEISYGLDEALELLALLEDVRETLETTGRLSGVVPLEAQIRALSRKLRFDEP